MLFHSLGVKHSNAHYARFPYRTLSPKLTTLFLQTALANKPPILQIFPCSKFVINLSTGWKVMAKKLAFRQQKVEGNNFLAITFHSVSWLISNFEYGKIYRINGFFDTTVWRNKVVNLGGKWLTRMIIPVHKVPQIKL